ncbi:MAG: ATP-binding protein [Myxococcaceae bacterium]
MREPATQRGSHAEWLSHLAGRLAARLAELIAAAVKSGPAPERPPPSTVPLKPEGLSPLEVLCEAFHLTQVERDLLLLAGLAEDHEAHATALRLLHPRGEPRPTTGLAAQLLCESTTERWLLREQLEAGTAVREGLLKLSPADAPFYEASLTLCPQLWSVLGGLDVWPPGVRRRAEPVALAGLDRWAATAAAQEALQWLKEGSRATVVLSARDEEVAFDRACALAELSGRRWVGLRVSAASPELEQKLSILCAARGVLPVVSCAVSDPAPPSLLSLERCPSPSILAVREGAGQLKTQRPVLSLRVDPLSATDRSAAWREHLPQLTDHAESLAGRFSLDPHQVRLVGLDVRAAAQLQRRPANLDDVARSVRARTNLSVGQGVQLLAPRARWADLVLPEESKAKLLEAVARLEHQGTVLDRWGMLRGKAGARGVRMLFHGPPGTGKSLSAEVLANALGVDLLWVDVSRVVSKWLGETEKNLAAVFDAAERAQAVLFFDEADALFASRTKVADAHDRYANLETGYLLSRLERFEGLAVLATNMKDNIDPAFIRRLEFIVDYDEPDAERRLEIWKAHLPSDTPLSPDVNLDQLAQLYTLTGGLIRNAMAAAGFAAAKDRVSVGQGHLLRAIRREFHKAGRLFPGEPLTTNKRGDT